MASEVLMSAVEQRQLQRIDHAADGVDDPACKQPSESGRGEIGEQLGECQHTGPSHADVKYGRYPFRAEDPEGLDQDAGDGDAPHDGEQYNAEPPLKCDQAHRGVASCDQDGDHHMIDLLEQFVEQLQHKHFQQLLRNS